MTTQNNAASELQQASNKLIDLTQSLLERAKSKGATQAAAYASNGQGFNVTVRKGEVETLEHNRDKNLDLVVYFGQRKGVASTSDMSDAALEKALDAACHIAQHMAEDACEGLADAALMANTNTFKDLDLYHPSGFTTEQGIELARECESLAMACDKRIDNTEGATYSTYEGTSVFSNSHGFVGARQGSRHDLSAVLIASDQGKMQRDYSYTTARDMRDLASIKWVAEDAARRTVDKLNAEILSTRKAPILFAPDVARGLIHHFLGAISGSSLYRESSFLVNAAETEVFSEAVTLREDPHVLKGLGSRNYDDEGVATRTRELVSQGVLNGYVLGSYSARRLGLQTTANAGGIHNLFVEPGKHDFEGMLKQMDTGLLVTDLMGQGVNLLTGDYSRGAAGFWVEGGKIQFPVDEVSIAGNLKEMFKHIVAVGNDLDYRSRVVTGSMLIESMTIAGQ